MPNSILLLHGALGCMEQLDRLREILQTKGWKAMSLNLHGHGGEPFSANFGIESFAEQVSEFIVGNQLKAPGILGYSMGGYIAMYSAYQNPGLIGNILTLGTKFDWDPESAEREVRKVNPEKILEKIPAFARILEHRHAPNDWKVLLNRTAEMMRLLGAKPLLDEAVIKSVKLKITVVLGDKDDMADRDYSKTVAGWLERGEFVLLPDTPHPIERVKLDLLVDIIETRLR